MLARIEVGHTFQYGVFAPVVPQMRGNQRLCREILAVFSVYVATWVFLFVVNLGYTKPEASEGRYHLLSFA